MQNVLKIWIFLLIIASPTLTRAAEDDPQDGMSSNVSFWSYITKDAEPTEIDIYSLNRYMRSGAYGLDAHDWITCMFFGERFVLDKIGSGESYKGSGIDSLSTILDLCIGCDSCVYSHFPMVNFSIKLLKSQKRSKLSIVPQSGSLWCLIRIKYAPTDNEQLAWYVVGPYGKRIVTKSKEFFISTSGEKLMRSIVNKYSKREPIFVWDE